MTIERRIDTPASSYEVRGLGRRALGDVFEKINISGITTAVQLLKNPELARPDFVWPTIASFSIEEMKAAGITAVLFDLDGSVRDEKQSIVHPALEKKWQEIRAAFRVACLTNKVALCNQIFAERYAVPVIEGVQKKPHPAGYERGMRLLGIDDPSHMLMVGDSLSTDTVGANLLGIRTALVDYLELYAHPERELWTKRQFGRRLDRYLMRQLGIGFSDVEAVHAGEVIG